MAKSHVVPYAINRQDDGVRIEWVQGVHEGFFPARALRLACPCAGCVEELSGRRLLDASAVSPEIRPLRLALVGAYGLRVAWSDGHGTGIYTFERLLEACPCPACVARRTGAGG